MKKALLIAPMASVHRRFNQANIKTLFDLGYEVHLVANFNIGEGSENANAEYRNKCEQDGIIVHSIPFVRAAGIENIGLIKELTQIIKCEKFDIVHTHTETGGLLLLGVMFTLKKGFKAFYTPHGMSFYKGSGIKSQLLYRPIEKFICGRMSANIAMNMEEYSVLKSWNKKTACFTHGIGIDLDRFQQVSGNIRRELNIGEKSLVITAVGELNENKNHKVVIEALSRLRKFDFRFIVCGVGPLKESLLNLAKKNGISDKVILLGYRKDIPNILADSDVFVFPSHHEGLPVAVMEAMAGGLPVVCSDIRGNNDLIEEGRGGFRYMPNNIEGFYNGLQYLIQSEAERKKMGMFNKNKVIKYSRENVEQELREVYK